MTSSYLELPKTQRALVLTSTSTPPTVQIVPTAQPTPGSVVVKILAANVLSYARQIVDGTRKYPFPLPFILGSGAVARVAAIGPDTTVLSVGQLVLVDVTIRGRDDPKGQVFLFGVHEGHTEGSRKLMHGEWRNATYSEYTKVPLENCNALDETRLLGQGNLGYKVEDLAFLSRFAVPYGGLRDIGIKAGKTVIIAPATKPSGGAAVIIALTMGARVIAMGRNAEALNKISGSHDRIESVQITGDEQTELAALHKFGPIDAFFDISPPAAAKSSHIKSGIRAVRAGGRVCFMGGIAGDVALPYHEIVHRDLLIKGKWMYDRDAVAEIIKMAEIGILKLGEKAELTVVGKYSLEEWDEAFTTAEENAGMTTQVVIAP